MIENCLVLVGKVVKTPKFSTSPAGIEHCQFSIDHKSIQQEAGMNRQAFVRIQVVATSELSLLTRELISGSNIKVTGFINRHESRNGNPLLVLHAQQIEMIN
ncbi:primosomal replication protein N [Thalassotalea profundi]|uniref:Replication restart protein PriB n=1 Tax=Thalassotalea profundi TaxID=2036687 RepID=A0ABQ3J2U4_9GAMM|nr:primosomal replication protein N [Thalassotalea profundi]GHE99038.1 primosomal replication protein N [Thalassotalea profundi]